MNKNFFHTAQDFLSKDFNRSLSIGYLTLVMIGLLFEYCFYFRFGINIVQYADVSDFILAPFRHPKIIIFTVVSVLVISLIFFVTGWLENRFPEFYRKTYVGKDVEKQKAWKEKYGIPLAVLIYVIIAATKYAEIETKNIKADKNQNSILTFKDNKYNTSDTLAFLGKTNGYIFLFNHTTRQTNVVPISDVLRIEVK